MKKPGLKIAALLLAVSPIAATAVPMVVEDTCLNNANACTVGIDGLDIMGMTFNVDFVQGSYNSVFTTNRPFFLGNPAGASAALSAVIAELNGTTNGGTVGAPATPDTSLLFVPYIVDLTAYTAAWAQGNPQAYVAFAGPTLLFARTTDRTTFAPQVYDVFATFEKVAAVPEPSVLSLLAISLAGLGISRRKAKSQRRA